MSDSFNIEIDDLSLPVLQDDKQQHSLFLQNCGLDLAVSTLVLGPVIKTDLFVSFSLHASEQPEAGSSLKEQWKALKLPPEALSVLVPPIALLLLLSSLFMRTPDPPTVCFKFDHADVSLGD